MNDEDLIQSFADRRDSDMDMTEANATEQVLAGAQLLQMHEAAAECRAFLQQQQHHQRQQHPILKPIPSRPNVDNGFLAALAWINAWVSRARL